jgi:hypothetical protein
VTFEEKQLAPAEQPRSSYGWLPDGWRPMWELPAPGKTRKFLYETPGMGLVPSMSRPYPWGEESLSPIGWRYA